MCGVWWLMGTVVQLWLGLPCMRLYDANAAQYEEAVDDFVVGEGVVLLWPMVNKGLEWLRVLVGHLRCKALVAMLARARLVAIWRRGGARCWRLL